MVGVGGYAGTGLFPIIYRSLYFIMCRIPFKIEIAFEQDSFYVNTCDSIYFQLDRIAKPPAIPMRDYLASGYVSEGLY